MYDGQTATVRFPGVHTTMCAFAVVMVGVHELIENTKFMNIRLGLNHGSSIVYTCVCMYTV